MYLRKYMGKEVEITIYRGIGRTKKIRSYKGRLSAVSRCDVFLERERQDLRNIWIPKPRFCYGDTVKELI